MRNLKPAPLLVAALLLLGGGLACRDKPSPTGAGDASKDAAVDATVDTRTEWSGVGDTANDAEAEPPDDGDQAAGATAQPPDAGDTMAELDSKYDFTTDWHTRRAPLWSMVLEPYAGRPDLHYLEVGVYEGQSAIWMLANILTDPSSRITGLDIFGGDLEQRFWSNIRLSGAADQVEAIKGRSQQTLRQLPFDSFHIIYIDGSHRARDVLQDLALSWDLLKVGGTMIMDDYLWEREWPPNSRPQRAVDAFLSMFGGVADIVHKGSQVVVRKKAETCTGDHAWQCVELGPYVYFMRSRQLLDADTREPISLSEQETQLVEEIARSSSFDKDGLFIPEPLRIRPEFAAIQQRLKPGSWRAKRRVPSSPE